MKGFVKICGITSVADAEHAASVGADAIGLNFWSMSPRAVSLERASEIARAVRGRLAIAAVVVDMREADLGQILSTLNPEVVQMHGDEAAATVAAFARAVKAVGLTGPADVQRAIGMPGAWVLLDAGDTKKRGGTGLRVDPALARQVCAARRTVLAGGLTPDNVEQAIAEVQPWGVDVASGVEEAPGVKHRAKLTAFVARARAAFARLPEPV